MFIQWKIIDTPLSTTALLSVGALPALTQGHAHSNETKGPVQLTLDNDQKWATDDNLHQGISHIRVAMIVELPSVQADQTTIEQHWVLAQKTSDKIAFKMRNCRLD